MILIRNRGVARGLGQNIHEERVLPVSAPGNGQAGSNGGTAACQGGQRRCPLAPCSGRAGEARGVTSGWGSDRSPNQRISRWRWAPPPSPTEETTRTKRKRPFRFHSTRRDLSNVQMRSSLSQPPVESCGKVKLCKPTCGGRSESNPWIDRINCSSTRTAAGGCVRYQTDD